VRSVARKLLDSKRQELKAGMPRRDVMSLLGLSIVSVLSFPFTWSLRPSPPQSKLVSLKLNDEEIIPQVR